MVAAIIKLNFKPGKLEQAVAYWNSTLAEGKKEDLLMREKLPGYLLLVNRKANHGYSIGLWDTEEASRAFENSEPFNKLLADLGEFCLKPPIREHFDIAGGNLEYALLNKLAA